MTTHPLPHAVARRAFNDSIRALYEDTLLPVREIARLAGVTERNIYALVRRLGCRPRMRLASGGGRRIVPLGYMPAMPLDQAAAAQAIAECRSAIEEVSRASAAARQAREQHAADRAADRARTAAQRASLARAQDLNREARALVREHEQRQKEGARRERQRRRDPYAFR